MPDAPAGYITTADGADNNEGGVMSPGDCFTIEPSLVQGSNSRGGMWDDGWTMATEVRALRLDRYTRCVRAREGRVAIRLTA